MGCTIEPGVEDKGETWIQPLGSKQREGEDRKATPRGTASEAGPGYPRGPRQGWGGARAFSSQSAGATTGS